MKLTVCVAGPDLTPDSDATLDLVHEAIARDASAWTPPVHVGTEDRDGVRYLTYATDAVPKVDPSIVTTGNVAPALLPPHIA